MRTGPMDRTAGRRRPRRVLRLLAAGALGSGSVLLAACLSERAATAPPDDRDLCASPTPTTVVIRDFAFEPAQMRVSAGESVTWVNCDRESHTSTADGGEWRSGLLSPGTSFSRTMDAAGTFPYHCDPHPFMQGTVVVE